MQRPRQRAQDPREPHLWPWPIVAAALRCPRCPETKTVSDVLTLHRLLGRPGCRTQEARPPGAFATSCTLAAGRPGCRTQESSTLGQSGWWTRRDARHMAVLTCRFAESWTGRAKSLEVPGAWVYGYP